MKNIKVNLFLNSLVLKDKHGNTVDADTAEDIRNIGEEVYEKEELTAKETYIFYDKLQPMLVFRDEDAEFKTPITIVQGLNEIFMFNITETPEEFYNLIQKAEQEAFKEELKTYQLEIPFK